ncbi:unnamed protein product [Staurois parvus]|uniref:Uncharacterized protein n=1 Tax=Staurois parvus TaxID=386267 RepID=A0ABN9E6R9_9NEOB|nr:unnamed protein product [Staurois parvus]
MALQVMRNCKSHEALQDFDIHRQDTQRQRYYGTCSTLTAGGP